MSSQPLIDPTDESQPLQAGSGGESLIANSILAKARWVQHALSPWAQRWLPAAGATGDQPGPTGSWRLPLALTSGATQRILDRLRIQYESQSFGSIPMQGNLLPLANAPLPESLPAAQPVSPAPKRAQGPYSKPFNSMEDFLQAVTAAKERNYAPPPAAELSPPKRKSEPGPYSKPFNSMEDFFQAVTAAKERNYAPPPASELPPAPRKHEPGPYSKAFSSFEDFVKAIEKTQPQLASSEPSQPAAELKPASFTSVRPISRTEELPSRTTPVTVNSPIEFPIPTLQPVESAPVSKPSPAVKPPAAPTKPRSTQPAVSMPTVAQVQRRSIESASDTEAPQAQTDSESGLSDAPVLQRMEVSSQADYSLAVEPARAAEPSASEEPDQTVQRFSEVSAPQASAPATHIDRALAQRIQVPPDTSAKAPPILRSASPEGAGIELPLVQRKAAETEPAASEPDAEFSVPTQPQTVTDQADQLSVQRQVSETEFEPDSDITSRELIGRQSPSAPAASAQAGTKLNRSPLVQRQVDDAETIAAAPQFSSPQRIEESEPAQPSPTTVAGPLRMPLVQRQTIPGEIEPPVPSEDVAAADLPTPGTATEFQASAKTPRSEPDMPLVQRQITEPTIDFSAQRAAPAPLDLPLVQRLFAEPEPELPNTRLVEPPSVPQVTESHSGQTLSARQKAEPAAVAPVEMPLLQRKATETQPPAAVFDEETETDQAAATTDTLQRKAIETQLPVAAFTEPAAVAPIEMPLLQRKAAATQPPAAAFDEETETDQAAATTDTLQRKAIETQLPAAAFTEPAAVAPVEMPLVQRKAAETPQPAAALDEEPETDQATATPDTLQRSLKATPINLAKPQVQRRAAEPEATFELREEPRPAISAGVPDQAQPTSPTLAEMPLVQRQPIEAKPLPVATTHLPSIQRKVAPIEPETEIAPVETTAFDLSERVLSRVNTYERSSIFQPSDLPLYQPMHHESQAEMQPQINEYSRATPSLSPGTLAVTAAAEPATAVVQRKAIDQAPSSPNVGVIQGITSALPAAEDTAHAQPDLDDLARQVYPILKRMLAVERERRAFR